MKKEKKIDSFAAYLKKNAKREVSFGDLACGKKFKISPGGDWHVMKKIKPVLIRGNPANFYVTNTLTDDFDLIAGFFNDNSMVITVD